MTECAHHDAAANNVIEDFMEQWKTERKIYEAMAKKVKKSCASFAREKGILAQVTRRIKDPEKLRQKLRDRSISRGGYKDAADIKADIKDLAGVRVALYFPNDKPKFDKYIRGNFVVKATVQHPKKPNSGYRAIHYHASPDRGTEPSDMLFVELQVITMLHHTWAEVEHGFSYTYQDVPDEEKELLRSLGWLVNLGDIYLERLYDLKYSSSKRVEERPIQRHEGSSSPMELFELFMAERGAWNEPFPDTQNLRAFLFEKPFLSPLEPVLENGVSEQSLSRIRLPISIDEGPTDPRKRGVIRNSSSPDLHKIEYNQTRYIGLQTKLPVPDNVQREWDNNFREDVETAIYSVLHTGHQLLESEMRVELVLCMAGATYSPNFTTFEEEVNILEAPVVLRPALWIGCATWRCRRKIRNSIDRLPGLEHFLSRNSMDQPLVWPGFAWQAAIRPANLESNDLGILRGTFKVQSPASGAVPGIRVCLSEEFEGQVLDRICTVGGIIFVQGHPYGLTTSDQLIGCVKELQNEGQAVILDEDTASDNESLLKFDHGIPKTRYTHPTQVHETQWLKMKVPFTLSRGKGTASGVFFLLPRGKWGNFALIDLAPLEEAINTFRSPEHSSMKHITGILPKDRLLEGSVWIIADSGGDPLHGTLLKQEASMLMGNHFMHTRQIQVHPTRIEGLSGAWVVRNSSLCGIVIAADSFSPYLHMIPAEDVINDISRHLGTSSITIASGQSYDVTVRNWLDPALDILEFQSSIGSSSPTLVEDMKSPVVSRRASFGSSSAQSSAVVTWFLENYERSEQRYYEHIAQYVSNVCEKIIQMSAIGANVTHRAKDIQRLKQQLQQRDRSYKSAEEIREDIVDLAGVRIALVFPSDKDRISKLIETEFDIMKKIPHSRAGAKKGLGAGRNRFLVHAGQKHTRSMLREDDKVEIQVLTMLNNAWSELEHDIIYKYLNAQPSNLELQMLSGLNGLVTIGELYLNQLHALYRSRVSSESDKTKRFDNEYELGAFLFSQIAELRRREHFTLSSVELLRKFLGLSCVDADTKDLLNKELSNLQVDVEQALQYGLLHDRKKNMSLIIMRNIYSKRRLSIRARELQPKDLLDKCGIMISTVISLHDLFPPISYWAKELTGRGREGQEMSAEQCRTRNDLKWLFSAQTPKNVVLGEIDRLEFSDNERIERLWKWFSKHNSDIVGFVFDISKLGVARDLPQDLETLEQICYRVERFLEP